MAEIVQATPEELEAFSKKCTAKAQLAETTVTKAITAVEEVRAKWGGDFAKAFGQQWAQWQKDMKEFPKETNKTASEMTRLAGIYRDADQKAKAATAAVGAGAATTGAAAGAEGLRAQAERETDVVGRYTRGEYDHTPPATAATQGAGPGGISDALRKMSVAAAGAAGGGLFGAAAAAATKPGGGPAGAPVPMGADGQPVGAGAPAARTGPTSVTGTDATGRTAGVLRPDSTGDLGAGVAAGAGRLDQYNDLRGAVSHNAADRLINRVLGRRSPLGGPDYLRNLKTARTADRAWRETFGGGPVVGTLASGVVKFAAGGEHTAEGGAVAFGQAAVETGVSKYATGPLLIAANTGVQLTGEAANTLGTGALKIMARSEYDRLLEENARHMSDSIKGMDITNLTKGAIRGAYRLTTGQEGAWRAVADPAVEAFAGASALPYQLGRHVWIGGEAAADRFWEHSPPSRAVQDFKFDIKAIVADKNPQEYRVDWRRGKMYPTKA